MDNFREWLSDNLRYLLLGLFIILALIAVFLGIKFVSSKVNTKTKEQVQQEDQSDSADDENTEANSNIEATTVPAEDDLKKNTLEKNAYPEVNAIIQKYYTALGSKDIEGIQSVVDDLDVTEQAKITKDQYLESYNSVETYTKNGQEDGTYIVFAKYNYKFKGFDTQIPGLSQLYVCTREDGSLYISIQEQDEATANLIAKTVQETDVQELVQGVQQEYQTVLEQNEDLKAFIDGLGIETSGAAEAADGSSITVKSVCNVRAEANENAEVLGKLQEGQQVTKTGAEGEWIAIDYEGATGYVRSDMFQ